MNVFAVQEGVWLLVLVLLLAIKATALISSLLYPPQAYAAAPAAAGSGQPPYAPYPPYPPAPADEPVRERSALGALTFGAALLTAGVLVALDRGDVLDVPAVAVFGSALAVVGLGLVVGAWVGRARGLIGVGVALAILTMLASVVNLPASNSAGEQQWRPATAGEVEPSYSWGLGEIELDLSQVSSADPVTTSIELGVGDARIQVPRTAVVELRAEVGAGAIVVHNGDGTVVRADGINRDTSTRSEPSAEALREAGEDAPPTTFVIDASVGLGQLEVIRA